MYCSSCGVAVAQGLSYCNYCGEKLNGAKGESVRHSAELRPEFLIAAMVGLFIFGLFAITALLGVMKVILGFNVGQILAFTLLSFLVFLSLEGIIIRLLLRRTRGGEESNVTAPSKGHKTKELDSAPARALPEPVPSVTEHTTRAFDPLYNERKSN